MNNINLAVVGRRAKMCRYF